MTAIRILAVLAVLAALAAGVWFLNSSTTDAPARHPEPSADGEVPASRVLTTAEAADLAGANERFCGACHLTPNPAYFPADAWTEEVRRGFRFFHESLRQDLHPPALADLAAYYRTQAPERLTFETPPPPPGATARFRQGPRLVAEDVGAAMSIAHVQLARGEGGAADLLAADMSSGRVFRGSVTPMGGSLTTLATLSNPDHIAEADLDSDGLADLVVADLGSYSPGDHQDGGVAWLRNLGGGKYKRVSLRRGLGRVADVQPADFDGDGVTDLVVAEFGWRTTGRVLLLKGLGLRNEVPAFEMHVLDERHGSIHVPVADLNGDGRPDFLALFAQEHETIEAFLNEGEGNFRREVVSPPQDPAHGSSGIHVVDLDQDGDLDVVATNGDMLDSYYLKPYHGITWLENRGTFPFTAHRLTSMPGVFRAISGDLDGDGDLDLAAGSLHTGAVRNLGDAPGLPSLLWLEQTAPGRFEPHSIEMSSHRHATIELGDLDGDGDLDLAAGGFQFGEGGEPEPAVTVWWNGPGP
jgi:FG-GAP-like repeat